VRMRNDNLLDLQIVFANQRENVVDVVARVNHHGFVRILVADHGAVALQRANRKDFVDHGGSFQRSTKLSAISRQLSVQLRAES
jgi:hypothetical protein